MASTTSKEPSAGPQLRLLGAPRLELAGGDTHALERHTAALLVLLALNGPTPRAKAAALVWPEVDEQHANNSLRQRIFKLRQIAGRDVIVTDRLIALADDIGHDLYLPLSRLADDPEGCQGELLGSLEFADCSELDEWVGVARQRWRSELARALAELASRLEGEGRIATALRMSERLVELDPTQEHAHRRVMRLHYLRGDRAAALTAFDRCRLLLRAELGVLPDRETQDLQRLIENSEVPGTRATAPRPVAVLRPPRLIGREAEWHRLVEARILRQAVLIIGEAGIGKSRLLADFAAGHQCHVVRARPGDAAVPYAAMARVLRAAFEQWGIASGGTWVPEIARILPELGPSAPGQLQPLRLRQAIEKALGAKAAQGLLTIALDDVQFADAASLELVPALSVRGRHAEEPVQWLLASRPVELPAPLRAWAAAQDADALVTLQLAPLSGPAVEQLLDSLALPGFDASRWAPALLRHTGGNPMFILETLRSLLGQGADRARVPDRLPLPTDVATLIELRLQQLSSEALNLARVAALAGQDFTPELAAQALETRVIDLAEPWRELEDAQIIRENAFAHDLILEATRRTVPMPVARALHRNIARILESAGAPAARIGAHWRDANEPARAAVQFMLAGEAAYQAGNKQLECALFLDAAQCHELGGDRPGTFRVYRRGFDAILAVRPVAEAIAVADKMESLAGSNAERADALFVRQYLAFVQGANAQAHELGERVIQQARAAGERSIEFQALRVHASVLTRLGRPADAIGALEAARALAGEVGTPLDQAQPQAEYANCIEAAGRRVESIRLREAALLSLRELGNWSDSETFLTNQAAALGQLGQFEAALNAVDQAYSLIDHISEGHALHIGFNRATAGTLAAQAGEYEAGLRAFEKALECFDAAGQNVQRQHTGALFATMLITLGQFARAQQLLTGVTEAAGVRGVARREALLGRLSRAMGQHGGDHTQRALQLLQSGEHPASIHYQIELDASRDEPAGAALKRCLEIERRTQRDEFLGYALHARVRQVDCLRQLDPPRAVALADAVVEELASRWPSDLYLPELWWVAASAYDSQGRMADAQAMLRTARQWIQGFAVPRVPEAFRHSFLDRNPVNRAILAKASRSTPGQS